MTARSAPQSKRWRKPSAPWEPESTTNGHRMLYSRALYGRIAEFLQEFRKSESGGTGIPPLKDADVFHLLVFLLRVARQETNGRSRSRAFLGFLQARFPMSPGAQKDAPRIIVP